MQHFQIMVEETVCDRFNSHLDDVVIQRLLEDKNIDNTNYPC